MRNRDLWLLVSGPSGVGKSTLIEQMLGVYFPKMQGAVVCLDGVVTATTRPMRAGEREGRPYYFLSEEEFKRKETAGEFVETIERHGAFYGTLKSEVKKRLEARHDLIMHIDWRGKQKLEEAAKREAWMKNALVSVFVMPESLEALRTRLERRGRNTFDEIQQRLKTATEDLSHAGEYDYVFTSGSYEEDLYRMKAIYAAEKIRAR
jgi:guanylate kinase